MQAMHWLFHELQIALPYFVANTLVNTSLEELNQTLKWLSSTPFVAEIFTISRIWNKLKYHSTQV